MQPFSFFQKTGMLPQLAYSMHTVPQPGVAAPVSCATVNRPRLGAQPGEVASNASQDDSLVGKVMDALTSILNANQEAIFDRLAGLDASINALSEELVSFKNQTVEADEAHRATTQLLNERLDRLDTVIGVQHDDPNALSLADRLDLHEQLFERQKYSQAPRTSLASSMLKSASFALPAPVRHDMAISTVALPATPRRGQLLSRPPRITLNHTSLTRIRRHSGRLAIHTHRISFFCV